jgi:hypothetical protein
MRGTEREMDVARRAQTIDWLKTEIVDQVARLFRALWEGSTVRLTDSLASLISSSYILGRRLGLSYRELDDAVIAKLRKLSQEGHTLEVDYGDLSRLEDHIRKR